MLAEYERNFESLKEGMKAQTEKGSKEAEEKKKFLKELGLNIEAIERIEKEEEKILNEFLSNFEPKSTERKIDPDAYHRERIARELHYKRFKGFQPTFIGADLLASDIESLKEIKEADGIGNPAVWFEASHLVKGIKVSHKGDWWNSWHGTMAWGNGKNLIFWFGYFPPEEGKYFVYAELPYHGFYTLKADDYVGVDKYAAVKVNSSIDVYHHFWHGEHKIEILNRKEKNINQTSDISVEHGKDFGYPYWEEIVLS